MELLYINFIFKDYQNYREYYYFSLNYIIGEKINYHSNIGYYIYGLKNIDKLTNEEILNFYELYSIHATRVTDFNLKDVFGSIDYMKKAFKSLNLLKTKNRISNNNLGIVRAHQTLAKSIRQEVKDLFTYHLKTLDIYPLLELYDENILQIKYSQINRKSEVKDAELIDIIYENIISKEKLLVVEDIYHNEPNKERLDELFELQINDIIKKFSISSPIFTFPCSRKTTINEINILRSQFQNKFNKLLDKIQIFRKEVCNYKLDITINEKLNKFLDTIEPEVDLLQTEIDENIYFQKIKNSDVEFIEVKLSIAIFPMEIIITFFAYNYVLSVNKTIELRNRLINEIGANMCEVCLYYEILPEINDKK